MNKNIFSASLVAILIIGAIVASFLYSSMSKRPTYSEAEIKKGNIEEIVSLTGKIQPQDNADLGFEIGGKITKLNYQVGDSVKAGSVLANANAADLQAEYRAALATVRAAQANVDQYQELLKKEKAKLNSLKKSSTANSADKKAQKDQIDASDAQVSAQEAEVAAAMANAEAAKAQIAKAVITAPFDGVISKQDAKVGEVAAQDTPIITLISQTSFKVEAFASEIDVKKIQVGNTAEITLDDQPEKNVEAKITAIDPAESVDKNVSNYKITLNFADDVSNLRSGIGANVSVTSRSKENVTLAPSAAVFEEGGKKFVYVSKNGVKEKIEVQTGIFGDNNLVEIVSGLQAGDKILVVSK